MCADEIEQQGEADGADVPEGLWQRKDLAEFLRVSGRWVDRALTRARDEPGSIPHVELPTNGCRRFVRFVPEVIREWARSGFPPVADFESLVEE